jgi:hypothetical protein
VKFDAEKGGRGLVRDARGDVIESPIRGDTETGEVECFVHTPEGGLVEWPEGTLLRQRRWYRVPLTVGLLPPGFSEQRMRERGTPFARPVYVEGRENP